MGAGNGSYHSKYHSISKQLHNKGVFKYLIFVNPSFVLLRTGNMASHTQTSDKRSVCLSTKKQQTEEEKLRKHFGLYSHWLSSIMPNEEVTPPVFTLSPVLILLYLYFLGLSHPSDNHFLSYAFPNLFLHSPPFPPRSSG